MSLISPTPTTDSPLTALLKQRAVEIGFELVGVAPAVRAGTWEKLDEWLGRGFAGEMHYIERRREAYQHPQHVLPQVRSVVMLGLVYGSGGSLNQKGRQPETSAPSPHERHGLGSERDCGERAGVRGPERAVSPPHSNPLPRNMHKVTDTSIAGEREQNLPASEYSDADASGVAANCVRESPRIARYAQGTRDYHEVIREKLKQLADALHELQPGCKTRGVVDTAPLLERDFARLAGLGWFGKNTLLLNKRLGSELFLAALLTDCELEPDQPQETQHCGTCTRCLEVCPTGAFPEPYVLDATKCISYLTIELRNAPIPEELRPGMGEWLFGCDECQTVCPWNHKAPATGVPEFQPDASLTGRSLAEWLSLTPEEFEQQLGATPLSRPGWQGIMRNACVVAGNSGEVSHLPALQALAQHADPIVSESARWAIQRLGSERRT